MATRANSQSESSPASELWEFVVGLSQFPHCCPPNDFGGLSCMRLFQSGKYLDTANH